MADVKSLFPEFKPKRDVKRVSNKVTGLLLADLKRKLKEKIQLEGR